MRNRWAFHALALAIAVGALFFGTVRADEASDQVVAIITERAESKGVSVRAMVATATCESRLWPGAVGDRGRSHGLFQLNDLPTGLLWHFYSLGYTDPYDPWQASDYTARVFALEFADLGIGPWRWSCYTG